jgi:hypothetical protein
MPAKWQQWMPLHIDRFFGSPAVQAMPSECQMGYLRLLTSAWQTEDCSLSPDPIDLAERSGLGEEAWGLYGKRILRRFEVIAETGRLRNEVAFQEWSEAKRIHDARAESANKTNKMRTPKRKADGDRHGQASKASRSADTRTLTITTTETNTKNPSAGKRRGGSEPDPRHEPCKAALAKYWASTNPAGEMPWDGAEAAQMAALLKASPGLTPEMFTAMLRNRFKSGVNHADRPSSWLRTLPRYANGPLDRFGQLLPASGAALPASRPITAGSFARQCSDKEIARIKAKLSRAEKLDAFEAEVLRDLAEAEQVAK